MSYILNALRRSERERQSEQQLTIENRVMNGQPVTKNRKPWLMALLIIFNLLTLSVFVWLYVQKSPSVSPPSESKDITTKPLLLPPEVETTHPLSLPEAVDAERLKIDHSGIIQQTSISEIVENKVKLQSLEEKVSSLEGHTNKNGLTVLEQPQQEPDLIVQENVAPELSAGRDHPEKISAQAELKNTDSETPVQLETEIQPVTDESIQESAKTSRYSLPDIDNTANVSPSLPPQSQPDSKQVVEDEPDFPYLEKMPFDFRRNFPSLDINVYAYSDEPDESFIMIDMKKFAAGQEIQEEMLLKAIEEHNMIIEYKGETFRFRRP